MTSRTCLIINPTGLHTRPARLFADTANERYPETEVKVIKGGRAINGKSVLSMLTLGIKCQESVTIQVEGGPEAEALDVLAEILLMLHGE